MKKITFLMIILAFTITSFSQGLETFDNSNATTSYSDGSFTGNGGIAWNYFHSRDDGGYPIDGEGLMLRRASDSKLEASAIPGGIGSFSMNMRKAYTGSAARQLELYVNGELKGTSLEFGGFSGADATIHTFEVNNINVSGNFDIRIKLTGSATTNRQVVIDNISWTAFGEVTSAATPAFSVPVGEFFAPFNLEITCSTASSTIYYTLNGDDPDNTSTEYTNPITINTTTTVKAIAYAPDLDPSAIAEATYTFPVVTEVPDLASLRNTIGTKPVYLKVTGEVFVTYKQPFRNQIYVQDATAAVLLDDAPNGIFNPGVISTDYQIGDGITGIIGTLAEYNNMLQFTPVVDPGPATSTGTFIDPQIVTVNELNTNFENYEAELVKITDVTFNTAATTFSTGQVYDITDLSKATGQFRTSFYAADYIGTPIPTTECNIIGLPNATDAGNYISSRFLSDIELPPTITVISPNGGEQIEQGTLFEIEWFTSNFDGDVEVVLHSPLVRGGELLGTVSGTINSFMWNVTQEAGEYIIIVKAIGLDEPVDMSDATFQIVPPIDIKITEIMYNSPESGSDSLEFIEFYNNGEGVVNFLDWEISEGVDHVFSELVLNPGEYLTVCVNAEAFFNTFGFEALQWNGGGLGNGGEDIELLDNMGNTRAYVNYDNAVPWPVEAYGYGPSLEFCNPALENNDPANWSASTSFVTVNADGAPIYATPGAGCNENNVLPVLYSNGWTGVSSNLIPGRMSMEDVFAPVAQKLIIILNDAGIYWPGQNINTIGEWDSYKGYKAKFNGATYFVFSGFEPENRSISMEPGTHLLPVLSPEAVGVAELIQPLGNAIEFMFDISNGLIYWPAGGILPGTSDMSLNTLYPGISYLVKVNEMVTIDFGNILTKEVVQNNPNTLVNTTSWNNVIQTGNQHIISLTGAACEKLIPGDFIGVFNTLGECTGLTQYKGNETVLPLIVYGDDATTETTDGMKNNEIMSVKIFRNGLTIGAEASYSSAAANSDGRFTENGLSIINDLKAGTTGIEENSKTLSIYPNPSNGLVNVQINGSFDYVITTIQGQHVLSGKITETSAFDLSHQPKGIYLIRLTNADSTITQPFVIK